jgi:ubiquinone/menaquinone biosynthesis C-methylase UbiE
MGEDDYDLFMPEDHMDKLYSSGNSIIRNFHHNRLNFIVKKLPKIQGLKILDAGCGEGHLSEKLVNSNRGYKVYGTDLYPLALEKAKKRCPKAKFLKQNLNKIEFDDNYFDIVICSGVIEHIRGYKESIKEMKRVTKNNGLLIISIPNEPLWTFTRFILGRKPAKIPDHINTFTPKKLKKEVKLKVIKNIYLPLNVCFATCLESILFFRKL